MNLGALCYCLLVPWCLFACTFATVSFSVHHQDPFLCGVLVAVGFLVVLVLGSLSLAAKLAKTESWHHFLFLSSLLAWLLGLLAGEANFVGLSRYYELSNLSVYQDVDVGLMRGQQLMDAGGVFFAAGTALDSSKAMGFRSTETYCVAPVAPRDGQPSTYDFWVVGVDCCGQGASGRFHCGDFNDVEARAGLRLLGDDAFYRLAVQQAEAAFGIRASHPLFFSWLRDPVQQTEQLRTGALRLFFTGICAHFCLQAVLVAFGLAAKL